MVHEDCPRFVSAAAPVFAARSSSENSSVHTLRIAIANDRIRQAGTRSAPAGRPEAAASVRGKAGARISLMGPRRSPERKASGSHPEALEFGSAELAAQAQPARYKWTGSPSLPHVVGASRPARCQASPVTTAIRKGDSVGLELSQEVP